MDCEENHVALARKLGFILALSVGSGKRIVYSARTAVFVAGPFSLEQLQDWLKGKLAESVLGRPPGATAD